MSNMMMQSMGRTVPATFLAVARQGLFFIPFVLLLPPFLDSLGVQIAQSCGDILTFLGALGFTAHILVIDYFSPKVNGVKMSCLQFLVCGFISVPIALIFEEIDWANVFDCWLPILYAGVLSCGVAYTLQIVAQKDTTPVVACIMMSMESVFAVVCAALILGEMMTAKELIGCVIMFAAVIIVQLPSKEERLAAKQA
jgi:drug/metabolite transporter (DMT)-like permease